MIVSLAQIGNEARLRNTPPTGIAPLINKFYMALLLTEGLLRSCHDCQPRRDRERSETSKRSADRYNACNQ